MSEPSGEPISRRDFLNKLGKLAKLTFITAVGGGIAKSLISTSNSQPDDSEGQTGEQTKTPSVLESEQDKIDKIIDGYSVDWSQESKDQLDTTRSGIDLNFENPDFILKIRAIENRFQRILAIVSYLNVAHSQRYNPENEMYAEDRRKSGGEGPYFCNIYAQDFLLGLLGEENFGSGYYPDGKPAVAKKGEIEKFYNDGCQFFTSNILDQWMREYGGNYGWQQVQTQQELKEKLSEGNYICLGVSRWEYVLEQLQLHPKFYGHAFILTETDEGFGLTQATDDIGFKIIPFSEHHSKTDPENSSYNFWVHKIPQNYP